MQHLHVWQYLCEGVVEMPNFFFKKKRSGGVWVHTSSVWVKFMGIKNVRVCGVCTSVYLCAWTGMPDYSLMTANC